MENTKLKIFVPTPLHPTFPCNNSPLNKFLEEINHHKTKINGKMKNVFLSLSWSLEYGRTFKVYASLRNV